MQFYNNSADYKEKYSKYNLSRGLEIKEMGIAWLQILDRLDDEILPQKIEKMDAIVRYWIWFDSFAVIFAYQFWISHPCFIKFDMCQLPLRQYWEYNEIETFLNEMKGKTLDEKVKGLSLQYCKKPIEKKYPDRESLLLELVSNGISIPEAIKITKRVRTGRGLLESMCDKLQKHGYTDKEIRMMKQIRYLKSVRNSIMKILYVNRLL